MATHLSGYCARRRTPFEVFGLGLAAALGLLSRGSYARFAIVTAILSLAAMQPRVGHASELSDLAQSMEANTWAELPTSGLWAALNAPGGADNNINTYSHGGVWNPTTRQAFFIGGDHNGRQAFIRYDEASNRWDEPPRPGFLADVGQWHSYSMNAINVGGQYYYYERERYNISTGQWDRLPGSNYDGSAGVGNHAFAYLPGLGLVHTAYDVQVLADGASSWTDIDLDPDYSTLHNFAEYLPGHDKVIYGGGDGSTTLYTVDRQGNVERLPDTTPSSMTQITTRPYSSPSGDGTLATHHPVSGDLLVVTANRNLWQYDLSEWTQIGNISFLSGPLNDSVLFSVNTHGVLILAEWIDESGGARMWVYKAGEPPTRSVPPADMTAQ